MARSVLDFLLLRVARTRRAGRRFFHSLESRFAGELLEELLRFMKLIFLTNGNFRRNIEGFEGRYLFKDREGKIAVAAIFRKNRMRVRKKEIDDPHVTVIFRDGKALMNYLFSPKPDILGSLLRQDVTIDGNLNYLYKFAYMANHMRLMITHWL